MAPRSGVAFAEKLPRSLLEISARYLADDIGTQSRR